jgi:hypothetical protein
MVDEEITIDEALPVEYQASEPYRLTEEEVTVTQEKVISHTYERFVIEPEQDIDTVPEELRAIVEAVHTNDYSTP